MADIDFKTDRLKHYIRSNAWLPACVSQRESVLNRIKAVPLRHFTFCAAEALEVFMLEKEGILARDEDSGRLEGVYYCEEDPVSFKRIAGYIGSPEQGFLGDFVEIVLFKDDAQTEGRSLLDNPDEKLDEILRHKLQTKDANDRFNKAFPFDIINLDVFGVMFPTKKDVIAPLLESILKIIELQSSAQFSTGAQCEQFTLFLTTHIDSARLNPDALNQLETRMAENISSNKEFEQVFVNRYGQVSVHDLRSSNFAEFFCYALPKYIIQVALFNYGWEVEYKPIYLYNRADKYKPGQQYQMMHSVAVFRRIKGFTKRMDRPSSAHYGKIAVEILKQDIEWINERVEEAALINTLDNDLRSIVEFRDKDRHKDSE